MHIIFEAILAFGLNLQFSIVLKALYEQEILLAVNLIAC